MSKNIISQYNFKLVIIFYIRFCYDSCESIVKNIMDVILFVEKYNCWEWIEEERINNE